jgi:hypothetical protein
MPNLVRQNHSHYPPPLLRYLVLQQPGTRLSVCERDIIYTLNRYTSWTHEKISSSLSVSHSAISASL